MRLSALLSLCLIGGTAMAEEAELISLQKNPFSQPEILKVKPKPAAQSWVTPLAEDVELNLTATLVSDTRPMAMVDGELLGIGDQIEGMRLIAVREGKAVFSRAGKRYVFKVADEVED